MGHKALSKETTSKSNTIKIERKRFRLELRENRNSRLVRLMESGKRGCSIVIIPEAGGVRLSGNLQLARAAQSPPGSGQSGGSRGPVVNEAWILHEEMVRRSESAKALGQNRRAAATLFPGLEGVYRALKEKYFIWQLDEPLFAYCGRNLLR